MTTVNIATLAVTVRESRGKQTLVPGYRCPHLYPYIVHDRVANNSRSRGSSLLVANNKLHIFTCQIFLISIDDMTLLYTNMAFG